MNISSSLSFPLFGVLRTVSVPSNQSSSGRATVDSCKAAGGNKQSYQWEHFHWSVDSCCTCGVLYAKYCFPQHAFSQHLSFWHCGAHSTPAENVSNVLTTFDIKPIGSVLGKSHESYDGGKLECAPYVHYVSLSLGGFVHRLRDLGDDSAVSGFGWCRHCLPNAACLPDSSDAGMHSSQAVLRIAFI